MEQSGHLVIVGGFAGSGKTELAKHLARLTSWPILDKDTLTRPLVEALAERICGDRDDRHSTDYFTQIRPLEYKALLDTIVEILEHGSSLIVSAPFILETQDEDFRGELEELELSYGAKVHRLWVTADAETMLTRMSARRAGRDRWKIANWGLYCESVDLSYRPKDYDEIDNGVSADLTLAEWAEQLTEKWK